MGVWKGEVRKSGSLKGRQGVVRGSDGGRGEGKGKEG